MSRITEDCIDHNAVRLIYDLTEARYEIIENEDEKHIERGNYLVMVGEIAGICEMAKAMREVLKC